MADASSVKWVLFVIPILSEAQTLAPLIASRPTASFLTNSQFVSTTTTEDQYCQVEDVRYDSPLYLSQITCWCSATADCSDTPYVQVDLGARYTITQVGTLGCEWPGFINDDEWITSYQIQYKTGGNWVYYGAGEIFAANGTEDAQTETRNTFDPPFEARRVRLYPLSAVTSCSTDWELYGYLPTPAPTNAGSPTTQQPTASVMETTETPSSSPSTSPSTKSPTTSPSRSPSTDLPSVSPSSAPTISPTSNPSSISSSNSPSISPTSSPTTAPSRSGSSTSLVPAQSSLTPTDSTINPTAFPSLLPPLSTNAVSTPSTTDSEQEDSNSDIPDASGSSSRFIAFASSTIIIAALGGLVGCFLCCLVGCIAYKRYSHRKPVENTSIAEQGEKDVPDLDAERDGQAAAACSSYQHAKSMSNHSQQTILDDAIENDPEGLLSDLELQLEEERTEQFVAVSEEDMKENEKNQLDIELAQTAQQSDRKTNSWDASGVSPSKLQFNEKAATATGGDLDVAESEDANVVEMEHETKGGENEQLERTAEGEGGIEANQDRKDSDSMYVKMDPEAATTETTTTKYAPTGNSSVF